MVRSTWLRRAGPGIVALGAVAVLASTTLGARDRPWDPPDCADVRGGLGRAARGRPWRDRAWPPIERHGSGSTPSSMATAPSAGQRLVVGRAGGPSRRTLVLPPESFAAGPFGAVVLVGTDDGTSNT